MYQQLIPTHPQREAILAGLDRVLDPELDESILNLGFVQSMQAQNGHLMVEVTLPTSWCAANFAYMMASDIRRELLPLETVSQVTVRLGDHFAADEIEPALNSGKSFMEAFPKEATENLGPLRLLFLQKGYVGRQERLLRQLKEAGLSPSAICALRVGDLKFAGDECLVKTALSQTVAVAAKTASRYLERRADLGLDCSPEALLVINLKGQAVTVETFPAYFRQARTIRVSMEANGSLCRALLQSRQTNHNIPIQSIPQV